MTPRTRETSSAETAARYHVAKHNGLRPIAPPAYATDGVAIPRRKRRILLDLAPETVETLLKAIRLEGHFGEVPMGRANAERVLVEALEKAR